MAAPFLLTKPLQPKKGRRQPAFFALVTATLATVCCASSLHAQQISHYTRHSSSSGLVDQSHWSQSDLKVNSPTVFASFDATTQASYPALGLDWFVQHRRQFYFQGKGNILAIAALTENSRRFQLPDPGQYSLSGQAHKLVSTQLGFQAQFQPTPQITLQLRPYIFQVHDYERIQGQGSLNVQPGAAQVTGLVHRVGTRQYGFLVNERPDKGSGAGLDAKAQISLGNWSIDWVANNLLHHIEFSSVHFSNTRYNVAASDGQIVIRRGSEFSVVGDYGITKKNDKLPVENWLGFSHASHPALSAGVYAVGSNITPWAAYQVASGAWSARLQTVAFQNYSIVATWQPNAHWHLGLGFTQVPGKKALLSHIQLAYGW